MAKRENKPDVEKVSDSEWEVMHILWKHGVCSASQVCEALAEPFGWSPKTVRTFLARLVQKNVVGVVLKNGINHYVSLIEETSAKKVIGQTFLQKFFSGVLPTMVAHFVNDENVTMSELAQLQQVIEQRREQIGKNIGNL